MEMNIEEFYRPKIIYAIGGGTLIGLGIGFFYLISSILIFVGCLLTGVGLGLMVAAIISTSNK